MPDFEALIRHQQDQQPTTNKRLKVVDKTDFDNKEYVLSNVDLKLHKNEILGIAGVQGNGQTELIEALTGLRSVSSGKISYFGILKDS